VNTPDRLFTLAPIIPSLPFGREARASGDDEGDAESSAQKHAKTVV
jgi:hypothetical protein